MEGSDGKKKIIINLSVLFANLADSFASSSVSSYSSRSYNTNHSKSPRIFQNTSVVGLSIVAAMMTSNDVTSTENISSSPPSRPIPIVFSSSSSTTEKPRTADYDDELSESYTCVVSHSKRNDNLVHKRLFLDDADGDDRTRTPDHGLFFASSSPMNVGFGIRTEFWRRDFISSCFLCIKKLHGLDIFMYRGEKAFCSAECRDKNIRSDDLKDNCGSEARKQLDFSVSPPCSGPQPIAVA